jgi:hypothetical protein
MLKMQQRKQSLKLQKQSNVINNELYQKNMQFENGISIHKI